MPSNLKRIKKNTEEFVRIKKSFDLKGTRQKTTAVRFGNNLYQVTVARNNEIMIFRQVGNRHIGKRTYFQRGMRTRESTKFSAIRNHVSFELPLPAPSYVPQETKFLSYQVPHTPLLKKRKKTQYAVMGNQSAHDHILENTRKSGFVTRTGRHEWLHLQAHSHGGPQSSNNLVAGSRDSNSLQIGVEDALIFCSNLLKKMSDNEIQLQVDVSCPTLPGTHIGTVCTYQPRIIDVGQASTITCAPIRINMHFHASHSLRGLQYDHVRVVFKECCRKVLSKAADLLAIDADQLLEEQEVDCHIAQHLSDENIERELDEADEEDMEE